MTFTFNSYTDYYIFIDADDGNKIKAKSHNNDGIVSTHATNADVVINAAYTSLPSGASIFIGDGTFDIYALKSQRVIEGAIPYYEG